MLLGLLAPPSQRGYLWATKWLVYGTLLYMLTSSTGEKVCSSDVCAYDFHVHRARTMSYTNPRTNVTHSVHLNQSRLQVEANLFFNRNDEIAGTYVNADDVVTADGYKRYVIAINGRFPGPTIEVMEGVQVEIRVHNSLFAEGITIHFHGIQQANNFWMDGVPFISQCPIQPGQSFTYRVRASPAGTHWYHSHVTNQRMDGLFGLLIVHQTKPTMPEIALSLMDWYHDDSEITRVSNPFISPVRGLGVGHQEQLQKDFGPDDIELSSLQYVSALINGRGRCEANVRAPLHKIHVTPGLKHRVRVVHTGAEYPFQVSIDSHLLTVVAADGKDIQPLGKIDYVVIFPGENYDFILTADQHPSGYWFRARTLTGRIGHERTFDWKAREVKAEVYYGESSNIEPSTQPKECTPSNRCRVFNCPFLRFPDASYRDCVHISRARSIEDVSDEFGLGVDPDVERLINMQVSGGSSFDGYRFESPSLPLHQGGLEQAASCHTDECQKGNCRCTHTLDLPFNKTVQLVFSALLHNPKTKMFYHHPLHLHGHHFAVLKVGYASIDFNGPTRTRFSQTEDILCDRVSCRSPYWAKEQSFDLNLKYPVLKETVLVPAGGYVVIRFRTTNPGYWLVHCHQESHALEGMNMIISEATERLPPTPPGFPTCSNFDWTADQFQVYEKELKDRLRRETMLTDERNKDQPDGKYSITVYLVTVALLCLLATLIGLLYKRVIRRKTRSSSKGFYHKLEMINSDVDSDTDCPEAFPVTHTGKFLRRRFKQSTEKTRQRSSTM